MQMGMDFAPAKPESCAVRSLIVRKSLAFAKWQYPYTLTPEQKDRKAALNKREELEHSLPEGANRELYHAFFAALREKRAKWMDESKDYCRSKIHTLEPGNQAWVLFIVGYDDSQTGVSCRRVLFTIRLLCVSS